MSTSLAEKSVIKTTGSTRTSNIDERVAAGDVHVRVYVVLVTGETSKVQLSTTEPIPLFKAHESAPMTSQEREETLPSSMATGIATKLEMANTGCTSTVMLFVTVPASPEQVSGNPPDFRISVHPLKAPFFLDIS
jgi:hypothetical protein